MLANRAYLQMTYGVVVFFIETFKSVIWLVDTQLLISAALMQFLSTFSKYIDSQIDWLRQYEKKPQEQDGC